MKEPTDTQIIEAIIEAQNNRSVKCPYCGGWQIEEQDCFVGKYHHFRCASCGRIESVMDKDKKAVDIILTN